MKKALLVACLMGLSVPAIAGNNSNNSDTINNYGDTVTNNQGGQGGHGGTGIGIAGASASAEATASVKNSNMNLQGQQQGQLQGQSQSTSNSNNAALNSSVTVGGDTTIVKSPDIPVATAYAPNNFPTATCRIALSGGIQLMNIGLSGGGSVLDENCAILETARGFDQAGYKLDGLYVRCQNKYAASAPSCKALKEEGAN